jgi:hypothetical protein
LRKTSLVNTSCKKTDKFWGFLGVFLQKSGRKSLLRVKNEPQIGSSL